MHEIIERKKKLVQKSVEKRAETKALFDSLNSNLSTVQPDKLRLSVSELSDSGVVTLIQEGAVVDSNDIRFVFSRGSIEKSLQNLKENKVTKLEVNVDHSDSLINGNVGYVDISRAIIVESEAKTSKLTAPIVLDTSRIAIQEIKKQQELGLTFGVSIEIDDEGFEPELVEVDNNLEVLIKNFQIKNLSIVREGANTSSNNILFNLTKMSNTNLQSIVDEEIKEVVETTTEATTEATPEVVETVVEDVASDVQKVIEDAQKKDEEVAELKAQLSLRDNTINTINSQLNSVKSLVKVTSVNVEKKLAPSTVTTYTGTNYNPQAIDLTRVKLETDPVVSYLESQDDDSEYPLQPEDLTTNNFKPVVRSNEFYGWDAGAFNPATECCWKVNPTGTAGQAVFKAGIICTSVDIDQYNNLYKVNGQNFNFGNVGKTPFQVKQELAISVLQQRYLYTQLQGSSTAPVGVFGKWDGLAGVFSLAPSTISATGSIMSAIDTGIMRFSNWFPQEVSPDGSGLVIFMHNFTLNALNEELKRKMIQGVTFNSVQDKMSYENGEFVSATYRGVKIYRSANIVMDVSNTATAGLTEMYMTTDGNVGAKKKYLSMENGVVEYSDNGTITPIQIGANALSAVPNCELSSTLAYFLLGVVYAKSRFKLLRFTNVQSLPYGASQLNNIRDIVGVNFTGKFSTN